MSKMQARSLPELVRMALVLNLTAEICSVPACARTPSASECGFACRSIQQRQIPFLIYRNAMFFRI